MQRNVLELLEQSAKNYPQKTAVRDSHGEVTFTILCETSKKIGSALVEKVKIGQVVPVFAEKKITTLEAFLGIVYAGGCYSLLNPIQPKERIIKILDVLEAPFVITDRESYQDFMMSGYSGSVFLVEELAEGEINEEKLSAVRERMIDTDPLYVNFTSGSTGIPKGVLIAHRSVLEFIDNFTQIFEITSEDIIGNQAPFDFDVSVKDIYSMLSTGATMYMIPKELFAFPMQLLDLIEKEKITVLIWAVSALCMITSLKGFRYKIPYTVKKVLFSGEVMPTNHLREWMKVLPDATFINLYGPTEITCNCTYYIVPKDIAEDESIPIGKAFPNERVFLLNENDGEIFNEGIQGEICVAGSALALGYYSAPEKTAQAFIQNPLNHRSRELIYKTGDMAYYRQDGNLIYSGRKDFQIKHMGHRIELGEIDACMNRIPGIERACCLYDDRNKKIIAFYQGDIEKRIIKNQLKKFLIKYMCPEKYIAVSQMPITRNGKIDRKKLMEEYSGGK